MKKEYRKPELTIQLPPYKLDGLNERDAQPIPTMNETISDVIDAEVARANEAANNPSEEPGAVNHTATGRLREMMDELYPGAEWIVQRHLSLQSQRRVMTDLALKVRELQRTVLWREEQMSRIKQRIAGEVAKDKANYPNDDQRKAEVNKRLVEDGAHASCVQQQALDERELDRATEALREDEFNLKLALIMFEAEALGSRDLRRGYDRRLITPTV